MVRIKSTPELLREAPKIFVYYIVGAFVAAVIVAAARLVF
jgi:hypothetical protein